MKNQYWAVKLGDSWRLCPKEFGQNADSATRYTFGIPYNPNGCNPPKVEPLGTRKNEALKKLKELYK